MPFYEQKILNCIPGGHKNSIVEKPLSHKDIPGFYKGDFNINREPFISTEGRDPVYFNRDYQTFKHFNGRKWVDILPTDDLIFGKLNFTWLGPHSKLRESENVNNYGAALNYLTSKLEYDAKHVYCYYDKINQHQFSEGQGVNVKKVVSYIENDDTSIVIKDGKVGGFYINKAVTWDDHPFNIENPKVKLAGDNEEVVGSIVGSDNGKIEVAVEGWDISFINGTNMPLRIGTKILGMKKKNEYGFVQSLPKPNKIYSPKYHIILNNAKGRVVDGGYPDKSIVKVAFNFTR